MFFDAYGWNPDLGFGRALTALGWTSQRSSGGPPDEALQHPLVVRDFPKAAAILREPAPTYEKLRAALSEPR